MADKKKGEKPEKRARQGSTKDSGLPQTRAELMELHRLHWPAFECECEVRPLDGM